MVIKKVRGGYVILHHRTKGKIGKRIPATEKPIKSYKKVLSIHRAIFASKARRKKRK